MDPQAFWNEVFIKTLVEEVSMVVSLQDLMIEPVVALPQFQKLRRGVSGSSRGGF